MRLGPVLRRLTVKQYRHVAPGTTVEFGPDSNLVLGRNGTGKSTLLALARAAHALDFRGLEGEPFDLAVRLEGHAAWIEVRVICERGPPDGPGWVVKWWASGEADLGGTVVAVDASQDERSLRVSVDRGPSAEVAAAPIVSPPWMQQAFQPARAGGVVLWRFGIDAVVPVDEALGAYETLKEVRFVLSNRSNSSGFVGGSPGPTSILVPLYSAATESERDLTLRGVAFADTSARLMGFTSAEVQLRELSTRGRPGADREREFGELRCVFERADGTRVADDQLSFGQKRLLAFLYAVDCSRVAVCADELVNGFHHDWIASSLEVLSDGIPGEVGDASVQRQSVLTSQNPLLVDAIGFRSAEDMSQRIVVCRTEVRDGREVMVWENLSVANAERLWASKEVGLQSVSELLRTQGLW